MNIEEILEKDTLTEDEEKFLSESKLTKSQKEKYEKKLLLRIEKNFSEMNNIKIHAQTLYKKGKQGLNITIDKLNEMFSNVTESDREETLIEIKEGIKKLEEIETTVETRLLYNKVFAEESKKKLDSFHKETMKTLKSMDWKGK